MVKITSKSRVVRASLLDGFGRAAEQAVRDAILRPVQGAIDGLFDHLFTRALGYFVAAMLLGAGVVLAVQSAVEALRSAGLPLSVATAVVATASLVGGIVLTRSMKSNQDS